MSITRLVLVRHGRTASNAQGRFQGHLDVDLDETGHAQAVAVAAWLAKSLADDAARGAVRLVSSDLARARETAEPIAAALGVELEQDAALRERDGGDWQGLLRSEIQERYPDEFARWITGEDLMIGGGESLGQCWQRFEAGLRRQIDAGGAEVLVVVGHGASMRGGMLRLVGLIGGGSDDLATYRRLGGFGNCHWAELTLRSGAWVLEAHNLRVPG